MNRILSVVAFGLLVSTPAMAQEPGTFPGCTPKPDVPSSITNYFSSHNKPLPSDWCVADLAGDPAEQAAIPEDGAPLEEEVPPQAQDVPEEALPNQEYPEDAPPQEAGPPQEAYPEGAPPPEAYPEGPPPPLPPEGVYVGPRGFALNLPGLFNFRFNFERRQARREMRWRKRGWRNGYSY